MTFQQELEALLARYPEVGDFTVRRSITIETISVKPVVAPVNGVIVPRKDLEGSPISALERMSKNKIGGLQVAEMSTGLNLE
jgi:hypothetical protein